MSYYQELARITKSLAEYQSAKHNAETIRAQAERDIDFEDMRIRNATERLVEIIPKIGLDAPIAAQALREASAAYPLETAYGGAEHAIQWLSERADQTDPTQAPATTGASSCTEETP